MTRYQPEVFAEEVSAATNRKFLGLVGNRGRSWLDRVRLRRVFDTGERVETALNFLESASTFASTFAVLSRVNTDKTTVFTGVLCVIAKKRLYLGLFVGHASRKCLF